MMNWPALESFVAALVWTIPFVVGKGFRRRVSGSHSWLSFAAGISIAYVFVELLPHMSRMQQTFSAAAVGRAHLLPEYQVYAAALAGFVVFYAMETMVTQSGTQRRGLEKGESPRVYRFQIAGFAGYGALMSYLLLTDAKESLISLSFYCVAMFFHFLVVDHCLRARHGHAYARFGCWIIASAIPVGCLLSLINPSSEFLAPTLLGFIGGGVVINSLLDELPGRGEGRVVPFLIGTLGYAAVILIIELSEKQAHL